MNVSKKIFRSYDIRGIYPTDINEDTLDRIGNALAQYIRGDVVVACDARLSSKTLLAAFINGVLNTGKNVMHLGELPLPVAMAWASAHKMELAYVTASHLPSEWNGVKFFHHSGVGFMEEENYSIRDVVMSNTYKKSMRGLQINDNTEQVKKFYTERTVSKVGEKNKLRVLLDCGNGTAGLVAATVFRKAGFDTDVIFETPDGSFPNRLSDPREDPLNEMQSRIGRYDIGFAYDGDVDRFVVMTKSGKKLSPEQTSYIILSELLKKRSGPVVANVECSMLIDDASKKFNTNVLRCRVGHTFVMNTVLENNAVYGVEAADHYVISHLTNFDDALAVSLYFAYVTQSSNIDEMLGELNSYSFERIDFACSDEKKFQVVEKLRDALAQEKPDLTDGIRIPFDDAWVLLRASNTSPYLRLTLEAKTREQFDTLKKKYTDIVKEAMLD
jgi:phosphomannomutase